MGRGGEGRCLNVKNATIKLQLCLRPLPGEVEVRLELAAFIYLPEVGLTGQACCVQGTGKQGAIIECSLCAKRFTQATLFISHRQLCEVYVVTTCVKK